MIKVVKEVLPKDAEYHLAVSMGADSVAALFWMRWKGYKVTPLHFDHNLRAQNAVMHDRFMALCDRLGLEGKSEVWRKGFGTEAECREARLDFFSRSAKGGAIVTAHHLDDWIESYLMNCFRGHPNHHPFELVSEFPDFKIIHPFLPTRKEEFEEFLERNGWMEWVVRDETNSSTSGSRRNWIRHNILPEMTRQKLSLEKYARRRIDLLPTILEKSVKIGNIFEGRCIDIMKKVVRLEKNEFELDDGSVFPISPPLSEKISLEEFQEHYERACSAVQGIKDTGGDDQDNPELG